MKTEAHCPNCNSPFSYWRLVFSSSPYHLYCYNCHWRIDIDAKKFVWAMLAGVTTISLVLTRFVVANNWSRLLVLAVLWLVLVFILDIIIAVLTVNLAQISKPDENEPDDD